MTLDWWLTYLLTTLSLVCSPASVPFTRISHVYRGAAASIAVLVLKIGLSTYKHHGGECSD